MSFLRDFLTANEGTECPKDYLLWAGYGVLSAAIGPRIYLDIKLRNTFIGPGIYILLVGFSGGRKTFARDQAFELLREAIPDTVFAGDNETYQGVITFLTHENQERQFVDENGEVITYRPYCIFANELMDYLQNNPIGMVTFLTNIYDRRHYIYRLKHEESTLERPFVMMCSCSTPDWLTEQVKSKQFSEGYGRRTVIVCNETIIRRKPSMSNESELAYKRCIKRLQEIQKLVGPCRLEPAGEKWFWEDWYIHQKDPDDRFLRNWYSTKHINLLKVAMLTSASERDDLLITLNHLHLSYELLNEVEKNLPMVTQLIGRSETTGAQSQLLRVLANHGGRMLEKELKMATIKEFKNMTEQWQCMEFLRTTNQIYRLPEKDKSGIERVWILLPHLLKGTKS